MRKTKRAVLCALACALLCGCGGEGGSGGPFVPPAPAPVELPSDPEQLLTDAQLVPGADPSPPFVGLVTENWIRDNHHPVRSLTSGDFSDLRFLEPLLAGRRVVQLGESGHGVREFNLAKVRLIRFLHEEMGYDVLAFESGLLECWLADQAVAGTPPEQSLSDCPYGVWRTREVLKLFEYVRATHSTARPLRIAGFDMKPSGRRIRERAAFFRDVAARIDPAFAERAFQRDSALLGIYTTPNDSIYAYASEHRESLLATYDTLAGLFEANRARLDAADPARPGLGGVALMAARSVHLNVRDMLDTLPNELRDRGMADNLTFLLRDLYPDRKVIVWAHNAHIRHASGRSNYDPHIMMGSLVLQRHRPELYTIGFYMYRGVSADNARQSVTVTQHLPNSLEAVLYRTRRRWAFVDMLGQSPGPGREWMFNELHAKEWGAFTFRWVPREQYDGVFFVSDVSRPEYLSSREPAPSVPPEP